MYKTIRRALALLIAVALTATLAACASKPALPTPQQFSSPPTEAEIAEFRRTHAPNGGGSANADSVGEVAIDQISAEALKEYHVALIVEVIGDKEMREVVGRTGNVLIIPTYQARIVSLIAHSPNSTKITDYQVNDEIFVSFPDHANPNPMVGEEYIIIGLNSNTSGNTDEDTWYNEHLYEWNGLSVIISYARHTYYVTNNSFIIEVVDYSSEFSHTGESAEDFLASLNEAVEKINIATESDQSAKVEEKQ